MPARRDPRNDRWFFRTTVRFPDGKKKRLFGVPGVPGPFHCFANTKVGAQAAEQLAIQHAFGFAGDVPRSLRRKDSAILTAESFRCWEPVAATWQQLPTRKKKSGSQPDLEVRAGGLEPPRG